MTFIKTSEGKKKRKSLLPKDRIRHERQIRKRSRGREQGRIGLGGEIIAEKNLCMSQKNYQDVIH